MSAPVQTPPPHPNFIHLYRDSLPRDLCAEIIRRFETDERKGPSSTATREKPLIRTGTMLKISQYPEWQDVVSAYDAALQRNLALYGKAYPSIGELLIPSASYRTPPLLERIDPGQGFGMHIDASVGGTHNRLVAALLYLKDVAEGGFTEFPFQSLRLKPTAGAMALFPPFWTHPHRGMSPVSGPKYNLTSFLVIREDWKPDQKSEDRSRKSETR